MTTVREFGILALLATASCVVLFYLTAHLAPLHRDNTKTFITSNATLENFLELRREWRPRVLSIAGAHVCGVLVDTSTDSPETQLQTTVGIYSAAWLFLINLSILVAFRRQALMFIWGIFTVVAFGYAPGLVTRVYPWDMPALFFFTLFVICYHKGFHRLLPAVILVGALFKETTAVLCIAPLFLPVPWRRRLKLAFIAGALFVLVKVAVDLMVGNPVPFFSPSIRPPGARNLRLEGNVAELLSTPLSMHPIWINAGTLVALLALPGKDRTLLMLKGVAASFVLSIFVFAEIREFRLWFEMAPLAVYALVNRFPGNDLTNQVVEET
jgi:hypothetical protein